MILVSQHWAGAQGLELAMEEPEVVKDLDSIQGRRQNPTLAANKET